MNVKLQLTTLAGLVIMTLGPVAHATTGCNNSWPLNGSYGMQFYGSTSPKLTTGVGGAIPPQHSTGGIAVGFAQIAVDGAGGVTGISHVNLNGAWSEGTVTGIYNVNDDCSMSMTLVDASGYSQQFTGAVVNNGSGAVLIQIDAGTGVSAQMQSMRNWCSTQDLTGSFGINTSGSMLGAFGGNGPFSSVGVLSLDGQGNAAANESRFVNGSPVQVASTGSITVNADCSVNLSLVANDQSNLIMNYRGLLVGDQSQIFLVQSDPNTAVRGSVVVQ